MSPHLIQAVAKAQMDDWLRYAESRRLAAQARARRSASAAPPSGRRRRRRPLRPVFG